MGGIVAALMACVDRQRLRVVSFRFDRGQRSDRGQKLAAIKSERWPHSSRNPGRDQIGMLAGLARNAHDPQIRTKHPFSHVEKCSKMFVISTKRGHLSGAG